MMHTPTIRTELVPVELINTDNGAGGYQRKCDPVRVRRIAAAMEAGAIKSVSLSRRPDGSLWVYDGQHTVGAFRTAGYTHVPATIIDGTRELEARWFGLINGAASKRITSREMQVAGAVAGDDVAVLVADLMTRYGVVVKSGGAAGPNQTNAIGLIRRKAKSSPDVLRMTFEMIDAAWRGQPLAWTGRVISGVLGICARNDRAEVMAALKRRKITPQRIEDAIAAAQALHGVAGNSGWGMAAAVMVSLSGVEK